MPKLRWTKEIIAEAIRRRVSVRLPVHSMAVNRTDNVLYVAARYHFGLLPTISATLTDDEGRESLCFIWVACPRVAVLIHHPLKSRVLLKEIVCDL
jgi:hypothetical protein